jgi:hypothetical protein
MTDIGHRDVCFLVEGRFKGKHDQHVRNSFSDASNPLATPGPNRGADKVHGRNTCSLEPRFHAKIEIRRIDADKNAGRVVKKMLHHSMPEPEQARKML